MNGSEFAKYMTVDALASTIAHVWENCTHSDDELYVLLVCWETMIRSVGRDIALAEITAHGATDIAELVGVVSCKRDSTGRQIGNQTRIARLDRLAMLAADRWRRRAGYAWRRVPGGVRGSRGTS